MTMYDMILAGGGVAGLSLAYHLVQGPFYDARILLVDRSFSKRSNHALSFWTAGTTPYEPVVAHTWRRLKVAGPEFEKEAPLGDLRYQTVGAVDFSRYVMDALEAAPGVTCLEGNVTRIEDGEEQATVWVDGQPYHGRWVFDSRFSHEDFVPPEGHVCLWQRFQGWEIATASDQFDPETATLMDLRVAPLQATVEGWRFFYVLPMTPRRALVELVYLNNDYDAMALPTYIERVLGIDDYHILRREAGAIPLSTAPLQRQLGRRVMAIGMKGGLIKPSTGYGFLRIQEDAQAIVHSLLGHGHPFDVGEDRSFYRFCDVMMLRVLARRGAWALPLFSALFRHNTLDRVLRFMDESATPLQAARLTLSLLPRALTLIAQDTRRRGSHQADQARERPSGTSFLGSTSRQP